MDWDGPFNTELANGSSAVTKFRAMLGHYDFRVFLNQQSYVDVGAGSLAVMDNLARPQHLPAGLLGTVGRYCEVNETARISALSEHDNERLVNVTFSGTPFLQQRHRPVTKFSGPFVIGNNVILSAGTHVLDGAKIGDGVVVGAGSIVTKELEPFGIYVGAPARRVRDRPRGAAWWDFDTAYLMEHLENIEQVAASDTAHRYRPERPRFAILARTSNIEFLGFIAGNTVAPLTAAPTQVRDYVVQALTSEKPYWLADCWNEANKRSESAA